jgi:hypothetical protein
VTLRSRNDLIDDLIYLRKGPGLTLDRLKNAPAVIDYCGGPDVPLSTVRERLITAVNSLGGHRGGPALRAVYGVDGPPAGDTEDRRRAFAGSVGRKPNTVRGWENDAIEELAVVLLTSYYAGSETPKGMVIPHGGFLIEHLHVVTVIRDRKFFESHQTRTLLSLVDGAAGFRYGSYSPTEIFALSGGSAGVPEQHEGGTMHTIRFPKELSRGQAHTFSFRERIPAGAPDGATGPEAGFAGQTFESPTLSYTNEVCFLGDVPPTVWTYDKLSRIERPGTPTTSRGLNVGERAVFRVTFSELYGGLCSGIGWRWRNALNRPDR